MNIKNMKYLLTILLLVSIALSATAQINWLTPEELAVAQEKEPRKVLVDLYTDWCGWCKRMDQTTFADPTIISYVNENFYAVKFNGESPETISFNGKKYSFKKSGKRGYHELAAELTRGNLSYPTTVFLDAELHVLQAVPGYQRSEVFEQIITYFNDNHHKRTPWNAYQRSYVPLDERR